MDQQTPKMLEIVGGAYQAALDTGCWGEVVERMCRLIGAKTGGLFVIDPRYEEFQLNAFSRAITQDLLDSYRALYSREEARQLGLILAMPPGRLFTDAEVLGSDEVERLPNVLWLMEHFGVRRRAAMRLSESPLWLDALTFQFALDRGSATEREKALIDTLAPHLRSALDMTRPFEILKARFRAVMTALDRWHIGVILSTTDGQVVLTNQEAERVLDAGDGLFRDARGRLAARGERATRKLGAAVAAAARAADEQSMESGRLLRLERPSGAGPLLVEVSPLREARELGGRFRGAISFVYDTDRPPMLDERGLAEVYGLSPAERQVCRLLLEGLSNQQVAEARSVSLETVRTQVKQVLRKTSAGDRAGLVRAAAKTTPPIDPGPG